MRPPWNEHQSDEQKELWIHEEIERYRSGWSLERSIYTDEWVFQRDIERIYHRHWFFVGHESRVASPGDYFVFNLAESSLIVTRGEDNHIRVLSNVCRHRGMPICSQPEANTKAFVCPYHAWAYDTCGKLVHARDMPSEFDPSEFHLALGRACVVFGLIFVSLAEEPLSLDLAAENLAPFLQPHGFDHAKVAARQESIVDANWKLVMENFLECYHCPSAHPEYTRVNPRAHQLGLDMDAEFAEETLNWIDGVRKLGHKVGGISKEGDASGEGYGVNREMLGPGFATSSEDGKSIAPLMGSLRGYDGGQTQFVVGPVSYGVADCDHAVLFRFLPLAPCSTSVEMTWIVDRDAKQGVDYDPDRVTWLWRNTFEQDRVIINHNQQGVHSTFYEPGPYSRTESVTRRWIDQYLKEIW